MRLRTADLIARDTELGELQAGVDAARNGHPAAILVCGPAGVGKSRLVEESVLRFRRDGDLLLVGHCVDLYGEELPYAPFVDALRHLVRESGPVVAREMLGGAAKTLSLLVPDLADRRPGEPDVRPGPVGAVRDGSGGQVLEAFVAGLERAGRGAGRVVWLCLEDLQWADRATRTLLSYLLRVDGPPNLLVTATVRTDEPASARAGDLLGELLRLPHVDQVTVGPFSRSQVAQHLQALTEKRPSGHILDAVSMLGGGLPFYTELLAADRLTGRGLPSAVRSMVRAEVDRLDGNARTTVQAASVEAGRLPHEVLVSVVDGDADVLAGIADAVGASVLVPEPDGRGYRFRHALLRESVEAALLPADRIRWHARWAEQLESTAATTDDPLARMAAAHHWAGAGDGTRAFDALLDSAALANQLVASAEETALLAKALQLWPSVPDAAERAGTDRETLLRYTLIFAPLLSGRGDVAETLEALPFRPGQNKVRDVFMAYKQTSFNDTDWRPTPEVVALLRDEPLSNPWLARVAADVSCKLQETDPETARALAERAVAAAQVAVRRFRESGRGRTAYRVITPDLDLLWAERCRAEARFLGEGQAEELVRFYTDIRPRCTALSPEIGLECDTFRTEAEAALGRHRDVLTTATEALAALLQPRQSPWLYVDLVYSAADAEIALGDWDDALSRLDDACRDLDDERLTFTLSALAGLVHCWRGDLETAERYAATARSYLDAAELESRRATWETAWLEAEVAAARSDRTGARTALQRLWSMEHPESASHALWRPLLSAVKVNVDEIVGKPARSTAAARDDLVTCRAVAARLHRIGDVGVAWETHLAAELARLDGQHDPAPWAAAAEAWVAAGWLRERAVALLGLAKAHVRAGDDQHARDALDDARAIARRLGAAPLHAAAAEIAHNAGLESGARSQRHPSTAALTPRELEVLSLIAQGCSNKRIATELFISPKTVSVHVSSILGKLHASSRTEVVAVAQRTNLLTTS